MVKDGNEVEQEHKRKSCYPRIKYIRYIHAYDLDMDHQRCKNIYSFKILSENSSWSSLKNTSQTVLLHKQTQRTLMKEQEQHLEFYSYVAHIYTFVDFGFFGSNLSFFSVFVAKWKIAWIVIKKIKEKKCIREPF